MNLRTYFDAAASSPLHPNVKQTLIEHLDLWGNNNSKHPAGQAAQKLIDQSLKSIANHLDCNWEQLSLAYSGTDANRRFIQEATKTLGITPDQIWGSKADHSSILDEIPETNHFDPTDIRTIPGTARLICLTAANSETGRLYDAAELRKKFPDALILRDYSQSFAKGITPDLTNCDAGVFTPQKFGGPKHLGILYLKRPELFPQISKDSHTKFAALVAATATAFSEHKNTSFTQLENWEKKIRNHIQESIPDTKFHEGDTDHVPGMINVAFKNIRGGELMTLLGQEEGICISIGSACTSDIMAPTDFIRSIEPDPNWQYPIRISLHPFLTDDDIDHFCEVLTHYVAELRGR